MISSYPNVYQFRSIESLLRVRVDLTRLFFLPSYGLELLCSIRVVGYILFRFCRSSSKCCFFACMYSPRRPRLLIIFAHLDKRSAIYPFLARYDIQDLPEVDCRPGLRSVCVSVVNIDRPMDICLLTETILHLSIYICIMGRCQPKQARSSPVKRSFLSLSLSIYSWDLGGWSLLWSNCLIRVVGLVSLSCHHQRLLLDPHG